MKRALVVLSNKPLLLVLIALLATIKFVIQPILEWQSDQRNELARKQTQLSKGLLLLENQNVLAQTLSIAEDSRESYTRDILGVDPDTTAFQLRVQRQIESLIEKHNLKVRSANWLQAMERRVSIEHRLEVSMSGSNKDLWAFVMDVEQLTPKLSIVQFNTAMSKMMPNANRLGTFNGKVVILGWQSATVGQEGV